MPLLLQRGKHPHPPHSPQCVLLAPCPAETVAESAASADATGSESRSNSGSAANGSDSPPREEQREAAQEQSEGGAHEDGGGDAEADAWAPSSAKLLDLAGDLSGAAEGTRDTVPPLAQTLADAFAAMPEEEVTAILVRKLREGAQAGRVRQWRGPARDGGGSVPNRSGGGGGGGGRGEVEGGRGGDGGAAADAPMTDLPCQGQREGGEGVAHAVADACRDIVLTCLLGGTGRQR